MGVAPKVFWEPGNPMLQFKGIFWDPEGAFKFGFWVLNPKASPLSRKEKPPKL